MSDLFHPEVPDDYIRRVFEVMALSKRHTFQVLTKRPGPMRALMQRWERQRRSNGTSPLDFMPWPLPNVHLGVSAEDQKWADVRIPILLETPAAVRFVSAEPLLGPIEMFHSHCPTHDFGGGMCTFSCPQRRRIDWCIVGGESGHGARRMDPQWARSLRDQCGDLRIAFHFKQAGAVLAREWGCKKSKGGDPTEWPESFPRQYPQELADAYTDC